MSERLSLDITKCRLTLSEASLAFHLVLIGAWPSAFHFVVRPAVVCIAQAWPHFAGTASCPSETKGKNAQDARSCPFAVLKHYPGRCRSSTMSRSIFPRGSQNYLHKFAVLRLISKYFAYHLYNFTKQACNFQEMVLRPLRELLRCRNIFMFSLLCGGRIHLHFHWSSDLQSQHSKNYVLII